MFCISPFVNHNTLNSQILEAWKSLSLQHASPETRDLGLSQIVTLIYTASFYKALAQVQIPGIGLKVSPGFAPQTERLRCFSTLYPVLSKRAFANISAARSILRMTVLRSIPALLTIVSLFADWIRFTISIRTLVPTPSSVSRMSLSPTVRKIFYRYPWYASLMLCQWSSLIVYAIVSPSIVRLANHHNNPSLLSTY